MKTVERLRELLDKETSDGNCEDSVAGMDAIQDTASAAYEALPALLAVVEAAEVIATTHAPLGASQVLRTVRVDQLAALETALRKLDEVTP